MPSLSSTIEPSRIMIVSSTSQYQLNMPSVQDQIRVAVVLQALVDSTSDRASGLPSRIQDGSIGDDLRVTLQWPVSTSASGIVDLHGLNKDARSSRWTVLVLAAT